MTVYIAYLADEQAGAPTGVRIVEPPPDTQQAQRGNFYALVDLQGPDDAAVLTERILSAMQRTYYTTKGTQSQVLTDTMGSAQQLLAAEYGQRRAGWRAGVICIGLMRDRLAIAGMGDAFAFVTTDNGGVNVYPPDRLRAALDGDDPFALWPLHRQKVESGGALIAGGAEWLERVAPRTLASAAAFVTPENCQDAADGLREQAGVTDIPGLLLVFSWGDGDAAARRPRRGRGTTRARPTGPAPSSSPLSPSSSSSSPSSLSSSPSSPPPPGPPGAAPSAATGVPPALKAAAVYPAATSPPAAPPVRGRAGAGLPTALNASPPVVSASASPPSAGGRVAASTAVAAAAAAAMIDATAPPPAVTTIPSSVPPPAPGTPVTGTPAPGTPVTGTSVAKW